MELVNLEMETWIFYSNRKRDDFFIGNVFVFPLEINNEAKAHAVRLIKCIFQV